MEEKKVEPSDKVPCLLFRCYPMISPETIESMKGNLEKLNKLNQKSKDKPID